MNETLTNDYEDIGEISIGGADIFNIPVGISLQEPNTILNGDPVWRLVADCYHPRRDLVTQWAFEASAPKRETLVDLVHKYWLPLFQSAVKSLTELKVDDMGETADLDWGIEE